ncbi:hypothetical protein ACFLQG_01835 [Candidatus Zixiibacteriota bacterium]
MFLRKATTLTLVTIGVICFGWFGCSDDSNETIVSGGSIINATNPVETYFPLSEGTSRSFTITQANGLSEIVSFRVGKSFDLMGIEVTEWIKTENDVIDTGYFRATSSSLFYYEHKNSTSEKVLELPLDVGNTWSRYDVTDNNFWDYVFVDTSLGDEAGNPVDEDTLIFPPSTNKSFPLTGSEVMSVESFEQLSLSNGNHYSQAVKVSNTDQTGLKKNYYWYVANIGLVRYVKGATDSSYPNGEEVGELLVY